MTHRERFQKSPFAKNWTDLADSDQFQAAADCAMLEFQESFKPASDMGTSAANEWMRQGAVEYLRRLRSIALVTEPKKAKTDPDNLHQT
jgi:hypothetical protein